MESQKFLQLALELHRNNYLDEAINKYKILINENKKDWRVLNLLGVAYYQKNDLYNALNYLNESISIYSNYSDSLSNRGLVLTQMNLLNEALIDFNNALKINDQYFQVHLNKGNVLKSLGQEEYAVSCYKKAIELNSMHVNSYINISASLLNLSRYDEALKYLSLANEIDSKNPLIYCNIGMSYIGLSRFSLALESFKLATIIDNTYSDAFYNSGIAQKELGLLKEALESYDRAIDLNPEHVEAMNNKGVALKELGRVKDAIESYNKAIEIKPDYADAYWNKSLASLLIGDFESGWQLYEWRWQSKDLGKDLRSFSQPLWLGQESLVGKTILLHSEQGLGDTLQFCRFANLVKGLGARVILEIPQSLIALLKTLSGVDQFVAKGEALPEFDCHCPLMSLPLALNIRPETMSSKVPYLYARDEILQKWSAQIGSHGFKIAIAWQGRPDSKVDAGRSFPLELFEEISKIEGVRLISLQKNAGAEQLSTLPLGMKVEQLPEDFDASGDAFLDSAAVMKCVDLVITSDTALTHLAGALGVKAWLPLKSVPDWRWMLEGQSSPWYPNHTLFRQKTKGNWDDVFKQMNLELNKLKSSI